MVGELSSQDSTPASAERSVVFHLILVTLAGEEIQLPIELQEFDRLSEFENAVLESLPLIGKHSTFGCELEFVCMDTQTILADPIWDTLQECNCFSLVVRQCFFSERNIKGNCGEEPKLLVFLLKTMSECCPMPSLMSLTFDMYRWKQAFTQSARPPGKVVSDSKSLNYRTQSFVSRMVPSKDASVFAECCSLSQIGIAEETANLLAPQAQVSPHAFESCLALRQISFQKTEANPSNCTRYIPEGCFLGSGIEQLDLPADFNFLGPTACENCKRLQRVDLFRTDITAIWGSTFAHCSPHGASKGDIGGPWTSQVALGGAHQSTPHGAKTRLS